MKFYAIFTLSAVLPSPADAKNALRRHVQEVESTVDADISSFFSDGSDVDVVGSSMSMAGMAVVGDSDGQFIASKSSKSVKPNSKSAKCPPLSDYPQWRDEVGYWIGDLSYYQADGTPNESSSWPYRYDNYKGFITGNISGQSYRQRNVFLYPPQTQEKCDETGDFVVGEGVCGVNGNSKVFEADQTDTVGACDGSISGPFAGIFETQTTLVGVDNALLYQVFDSEGRLFQSQLTTMSGNDRRTRTAQGFANFVSPSVPSNASFYRERRVAKEEFYEELTKWFDEYDILDSDKCVNALLDDSVDDSVDDSGYDVCVAFLEQSFDL